MAKLDITSVNTSDTFQLWLNKTNELVELMNSEVLTASPVGDITIGNAILTGTFTTTDLIANNTITGSNLSTISIVNKVDPVNFVDFNSPISITSTQEKLLRLRSSSQKPAINLINAENANWNIKLSTITSTSPFLIETEGTSKSQFILTQDGDLTLGGKLTATSIATTSITGTITGTLIGNATSLTNLTSTITELNYVDGVTSSIQGQFTALDTAKAPKASPTFTGIPAAPTAAAGTNTTQIATTEFVKSAVDAAKVSPAFTGTPTAPTVTAGTVAANSTQIATTAFVSSTVSTAITNADAPTKTGTGASGTWGINITGNAATAGSAGTAGSATTAGSAGIAAGLSNRYTRSIAETANGGISLTSFASTVAGVGPDALQYQISMSGSYSGNFSVFGSITASQNVTAYSDERLKSNVRTIDKALDKVSLMRGVYFDKDGEASTGVIAQEVEKVLPEVVFDGEYKSVAYGNIVGILIEAIKELKNEIEDLKQRI